MGVTEAAILKVASLHQFVAISRQPRRGDLTFTKTGQRTNSVLMGANRRRFTGELRDRKGAKVANVTNRIALRQCVDRGRECLKRATLTYP